MATLIAPAINESNAKELQRKSVESRKRNAEIARLAKLGEIAIATVAPAKPLIDPYIDDLARAQVKYLDRLMDPDITAKDAAALSQALKNLRETYHMATGAPKPGTIKPESRRTRQSPARPPEPEPIDPASTP